MPTGWGTGTECNEGCNGTISAQKYTNTTIVLDAPDARFDSTRSSGNGVTFTDMVSEEGGKVWKIETIDIAPMVEA